MRYSVMFPASLLAFGCALAPAFAGTPSKSVTYTYQFFSLPTNSFSILATGIDSAGDIVGSYLDNTNIEHSYLYSHGQLTDLLPPGTSLAYTNSTPSISATGVIAATGYVSSTKFFGFAVKSGKYSFIRAPGGTTPMTVLAGVAPSGAVAGVDWNTGTVFLHSGKKFTNLFVPPAGSPVPTVTGMNSHNTIIGNYAEAGSAITNGFISLRGAPAAALQLPNSAGGDLLNGVNDSDVAVGIVGSTGAGFQGFEYDNGAVSYVNYPNAPETVVTAINDVNTVAGFAFDASGNTIPFTRSSNGTFSVLRLPGANSITDPLAINKSGVVTGIYLDFTAFKAQIFIATPIK